MEQVNRSGRSAVAIVLALVAWTAVLLQLALSVQLARANGKTAVDGVIAFAGYFTLLTNVLVAMVATAAWRAGTRSTLRGFDTAMVRGCATVAILTVGIGYHLLLRNIWSPQGWQWVADVLLHYVVPLGTLAWWLVRPPRERLSLLAPLQWTLYPVAYFVYALLRGAWLGAYPYPFIDVAQLGYARVLANAIGLLIAFVVLGYLVRAIAVARQRANLAPG